MQKIIRVSPLPDYRLTIEFSDGLIGTVDLSDLVGKGIFASWQDKQEFEMVFIDPETHTVAWPNGADLCPDSLHQEILEQQKAA